MRGVYEQARRFTDASPRPKFRSRSQAKPGAKAPPLAVIHILEDPTRGYALIRGKNVVRILRLAGVLEASRWSPHAKGHVVPMSDLPDIVAMAQYTNAPVRFKTVTAE
jgi:hypothetical protein